MKDLTHRKDGYIEMRPANYEYPIFRIDNPEYYEVWGVEIHDTKLRIILRMLSELTNFGVRIYSLLKDER